MYASITKAVRRQGIIWINTGNLSILDRWEQIAVKFYTQFKQFHSRKLIQRCRLTNGGDFASASMCYDMGLAWARCWIITIEIKLSPHDWMIYRVISFYTYGSVTAYFTPHMSKMTYCMIRKVFLYWSSAVVFFTNNPHRWYQTK